MQKIGVLLATQYFLNFLKMPATNPKHLANAVGYLYVAPYNAQAVIPEFKEDGSNVKEVFQAVETAYPNTSWKRVSSIVGLQISEDFSADKNEVITDDNGLIYASVKKALSIKATWYESKNPEVLAIISGVNTKKDTTDLYSGYVVQRGELPQFVVKIEGKINGKTELYYITQATVGGQVITQFKKNSGEVQGSEIEITASDAGIFVKKTFE